MCNQFKYKCNSIDRDPQSEYNDDDDEDDDDDDDDDEHKLLFFFDF